MSLYTVACICIKCLWRDLREGYPVEGGSRRGSLDCFESSHVDILPIKMKIKLGVQETRSQGNVVAGAMGVRLLFCDLWIQSPVWMFWGLDPREYGVQTLSSPNGSRGSRSEESQFLKTDNFCLFYVGFRSGWYAPLARRGNLGKWLVDLHYAS